MNVQTNLFIIFNYLDVLYFLSKNMQKILIEIFLIYFNDMINLLLNYILY